MPVRAGIDLGTTYSSISWFDAHNNRVDTCDLESADGAKVLRSVVYYPGPGQPPVVGDTAWNAARHAPDRVVVGIKRSMGTAYKTPPVDGAEYTPPQVSAEILKALARDAQTHLGDAVVDVVVTVPAYFGDAERAATEEAARLAGLNVLALLSEPNAAALAFAVEKVADIADKHLLVYDLGGGTFDVTLIRVTRPALTGGTTPLHIEVLCKDGSMGLGGLDWDRALAELVAEKVQQAHGTDPQADPAAQAVLLDNCEKAKRHLSRTRSVPVLADAEQHQVDVTVGDFEDRTRDLLAMTQTLVEQVLEEAEAKHGVKRDQIEAMLTGGSSRMPMVKAMLTGVMGRPPLTYKNPDLLVTIGAAYWAHLLDGGAVSIPVPVPGGGTTTTDVTVNAAGLVEVSAQSVGVEVLRPDGAGGVGRFNSVVIPAGAKYGAEFSKEFRTSDDNMTDVPVVIYEGPDGPLDQCRRLLELLITGLPPNRPKGDRVRITVGYDANGLIRGRATDLSTNTEVPIVIDRSKGP